ncbi:MAG: hypothetical protein ACXQS8_03100 [Candidatus Helarchaeales archaeon]
MKRPKKWILIKLAVFIGFTCTAIITGFLEEIKPVKPTHRPGEPYLVSINQLDTYPDLMEGKTTVLITEIHDVSYNEEKDEISFIVKDDYYNIAFIVVYFNFSKNVNLSPENVKNNSVCAIKGIAYIQSRNTIIGLDLYVLKPKKVYILSFIGLAVIIALILAYFKIDLKKLKLQQKTIRLGSCMKKTRSKITHEGDGKNA